jgi:Domain of unknown function (DUF932)
MLDNFDLLRTVLPVLQDQELIVESCELTERKLFLKVVSPRVQYEVKVGDPVQAGLAISNSEIGFGRLSAEPLIYRLRCKNGMISADHALRKYHVGKAGSEDFEGAMEFFRDETLEANDKAFWMKVADTVRAAMSDIGFAAIVERMRRATEFVQDAEATIVEIMEVTRRSFNLSDAEKDGVHAAYLAEGDRSLYGLINAITRHSQDIRDYERATEFERLGGKLLDAPASTIKALGYIAQ